MIWWFFFLWKSINNVWKNRIKLAVIIPIPKTFGNSNLNNFRPIALAPVVMKWFERLVLKHIKDCLPDASDSTSSLTEVTAEDAIAITLHTTLIHLEQHDNYVRLLFIDYGSTFNTIIPDILINPPGRRLSELPRELLAALCPIRRSPPLTASGGLRLLFQTPSTQPTISSLGKSAPLISIIT